MVLVSLQFLEAGGSSLRAVEPRHRQERSQRAAEGDEPEHSGQRVSSVTGKLSILNSQSSRYLFESLETSLRVR